MLRIAGLSSDLRGGENEKSPVESIGLEESNGGEGRGLITSIIDLCDNTDKIEKTACFLSSSIYINVAHINTNHLH